MIGALRRFASRDAPTFALSATVAAIVVAVVAAGAGLSRILPMLLSADVPARAALPFFFGVLALAMEVGFLVGTPLGFVECAIRSRERGEARARMALGESPIARVARLWPAVLVVGSLAAMGSLAWGRDARGPGRVARALVRDARAACEAAKEARVVAVPLVRASFLCTPGKASILVGEGVGGGDGVDYAASSLEVADDLTRIEARDVVVLGPAGSDVRVRAKVARISGLHPFSAPSSVGPWARACVLVAAGILSALLATSSALRGETTARPFAFAVAIAGPAAALASLRACEQAGVADLRLVWVPLSAVVATLLARAVVRVAKLGRRSRVPT